MLKTALLITFITLRTSDSADPCQTPNGQKGECLPINQCPSLFSHFQKDSISESTSTYLRRSHCGFVGVYPKVCCPTGSSTPPNQTLIATSDLLPDNCGTVTASKIFGGEKTDLDEFPWMALLQFQFSEGGRKSFECGGSLISKRYVLTAAHCLLPSLIGVRLGEYNTETEIDCITNNFGKDCAPKALDVGIEEKIVYESYNKNDTNRYHDIGLLRLDRDIEFNDFIKPICLPLTVDELYKSYIGQNLTVAGWGFTEKGFKSSIKLKVNVPVGNGPFCTNAYIKFNLSLSLDAGQICAGGVQGEDSCKGDSGGPLMTIKTDKNKSTRFYAVGLVSFGPTPCGQYNVPGVYTKVAKYVKWITEKIKP